MHPELEGIFREHSPMVFRVCLRYAKDRNEAEDLTQDVFLRIDATLGKFQGNSRMSTWIYRIAVNMCVDHLRTRNRRLELLETHHNAMVFDNLATGGDPELAKIDLEKILGNTDAEVREILFLTLAEGLSHQAVGELMGKTGSAIAKTVSRFRQRIQSRLGLMVAGRALFPKGSKGGLS